MRREELIAEWKELRSRVSRPVDGSEVAFSDAQIEKFEAFLSLGLVISALQLETGPHLTKPMAQVAAYYEKHRTRLLAEPSAKRAMSRFVGLIKSKLAKPAPGAKAWTLPAPPSIPLSVQQENRFAAETHRMVEVSKKEAKSSVIRIITFTFVWQTTSEYVRYHRSLWQAVAQNALLPTLLLVLLLAMIFLVGNRAMFLTRLSDKFRGFRLLIREMEARHQLDAAQAGQS